MTALLEAALALAREGYPVFPCKGDKKPACKTGFKDAQIGERDIVDLFERNALAELIGVPTGAASGFDALDIDPRHDGLAWLDLNGNALPATRSHRTRSQGHHFLFQHLDGVKNTAGKLGAGVDTRGEGGYIIWWPAHGFAVECPDIIDWWPYWLQRLLLPRPRPMLARAAPVTRAAATSRAEKMLAHALERVANAAPGQRHHQLRAAGCTIGGILHLLSASEESLRDELLAAVIAAGAEDHKNALQTIIWALEKGKKTKLLEIEDHGYD